MFGITQFDSFGSTVGTIPSDRSNWPHGYAVVGGGPGMTFLNTTRTAGQRLFGLFMRDADGVVEVNYGPDNQVGVQTGCFWDFYSNAGSPPAYTYGCTGGISASGLEVLGPGPVIWYNSAAGADLKTWVAHQKSADTTRFDFSLLNDAAGTENPWLTVHRTGANVTDILFPATTPTVFNGALAIGGGTSLLKHMSATASLDFDLSGAGITCQDLAVTVTGAVAGDSVQLGIPDALASTAGVTFSAWVSAADTCKVRACDVTSGNPNPAAATVRCDVDHH